VLDQLFQQCILSWTLR